MSKKMEMILIGLMMKLLLYLIIFEIETQYFDPTQKIPFQSEKIRFSSKERFERDEKISRCDYTCELTIFKLLYIKVILNFFETPREDSVISVNYFQLELDFDVLNIGGGRCGDAQDIDLVKLHLGALSSEYKLTTTTGRQSTIITNAHLICSMHIT